MFIRIVFDNLESEETRGTQQLFLGSPNGTCLSSLHSLPIYSSESNIGFWYLDIDILNKHYSGVLNALNSLLTYSGVKSVDILPITQPRPSGASFNDEYTQLQQTLLSFV